MTSNVLHMCNQTDQNAFDGYKLSSKFGVLSDTDMMVFLTGAKDRLAGDTPLYDHVFIIPERHEHLYKAGYSGSFEIKVTISPYVSQVQV